MHMLRFVRLRQIFTANICWIIGRSILGCALHSYFISTTFKLLLNVSNFWYKLSIICFEYFVTCSFSQTFHLTHKKSHFVLFRAEFPVKHMATQSHFVWALQFEEGENATPFFWGRNQPTELPLRIKLMKVAAYLGTHRHISDITIVYFKYGVECEMTVPMNSTEALWLANQLRDYGGKLPAEQNELARDIGEVLSLVSISHFGPNTAFFKTPN